MKGEKMATITRNTRIIQDPPLVKTLLTDKRASWLWLVLRVWLGYKWIDAALHKVDNPAWVQTGDALKGFWSGIVVIPETGRPPIAFDWYRSFIQVLLDIQAYTWFGKLVALGLIMAWKVSGYIGADYFLLPWVGTPWTRTDATNQIA